MCENFSRATKRSLVAQVGFPHSLAGKGSACNAGDLVQFPGQEDPQEKG